MLSLISFSSTAVAKDYASLFSSWKNLHHKSYESAASEASAFTKFAVNEDIVTTHNAKGLAYRLGHNEFSDLSGDEFYLTKLGYNMAAVKQDTFSTNPLHTYRGETLPRAVDWVTKGAVTPIKNQGHCGSCWAFSAIGSVEGAFAIASGKITSLSEEELVQCDSVDHGCSGGLMDNAFKFIEQHGVNSEKNYPYSSGTGTGGTCDTAKENTPQVTVTGFTDVKSGDEDALKSAVAQQPVSIAIEADKSVFQLYASGVLDSSECGTQLDHGVLLVGYGSVAADEKAGLLGFKTSKSTPYWKVKNSWGTTWGEEGYIRMVRGKNQCGIAQQPSYPTGAKASPGLVVA